MHSRVEEEKNHTHQVIDLLFFFLIHFPLENCICFAIYCVHIISNGIYFKRTDLNYYIQLFKKKKNNTAGHTNDSIVKIEQRILT